MKTILLLTVSTVLSWENFALYVFNSRFEHQPVKGQNLQVHFKGRSIFIQEFQMFVFEEN